MKRLFLFMLFCVMAGDVSAHKVATPIHQYITSEATEIWNAPKIVKDNTDKDIFTWLGFPCGADYDWEHGDDAVIGSGEEDHEKNPLCPTFEEPLFGFRERCVSNEGLNGFFEHFWDPDGLNTGTRSLVAGGYNCNSEDGLHNAGLAVAIFGVADPENGRYDSAYRVAEQLYIKALSLYQGGRTEEAFYFLGRIAHLLEDLAVPAHTHLAPHDKINNRVDAYEEFFNGRIDRVMVYEGLHYSGEEYVPAQLPNIPGNFNWTLIHTNPSDLFKLFWYTAQKTQYWATDKRAGNARYTRLNGQYVTFSPSLWKGSDIAPVSSPSQINNNIQLAADSLIPHALRAVAGLFRLFMEDVVRYPATLDYFDLPTGWQIVQNTRPTPAPLSVAIIQHNGTAYTVAEAVEKGYIYIHPYVSNGQTWVTSNAEIDEWSLVPQRHYVIYFFVPIRLWLVTNNRFPRTSTFFEDPLL